MLDTGSRDAELAKNFSALPSGNKNYTDAGWVAAGNRK
jgi:hypothetical protein